MGRILVAFRQVIRTMGFLRTTHTIFFTLTLIASVILITSSAVVGPLATWCLIIAVGATLFGFVAPRAACATALILLPLGGNRPATTQAFLSIITGASLFLGFSLRSLGRDQLSLSSLTEREVKSPLLVLALMYCFFSAASLLSVPLNHTLEDIRNVVGRESLDAIALSIISLARGSEHALVYSFFSVYLTTLSYFLGISVFRLCCEEPVRLPKLFIASICWGLMLSIVIGILDYYHFIDLTALRSLDPIVNPAGKQFRLQSLFGHSGWYAEYLTLTIPTCLIVLSLNASFWIRAACVVALLAVGEFVLILTYQRGGWISYPVTLCAVWAALYVVRLLELHRTDITSALRRSLLKVIISLPLTVVVSLLLVVLIQGRETVQESLNPYVSRFKEIQRTGDRTDFLKAGLLIGSLHPILGGGSDSFAWQFEREIESPTGHFPGRFRLPLHGAAHNVYAQTFSGKGLGGLLSLIAIPLFLIAAIPRIMKDQEISVAPKLIALTGACFSAAFLIYGNVQEVFYIQILQFLFFVIIAIVAAVLPASGSSGSRRISLAPLICLCFLGAHLIWEFLIPGLTRSFYKEKRIFGCFSQEISTTDGPFRWCGERGRMAIPVESEQVSLSLTVEAGPLNQQVSLIREGADPFVVSLQKGERQKVTIPLSPSERSQGVCMLEFRAISSFVPYLALTNSSDMRRLAFKVS